jgi:2-succinyl-5-enolpyruvyl-6-hydroxy-3-cyclohexene-1-carboxylate synthase
MAGQVGRQRAIASAERRDRPPPALPRLREPVQEDERVPHPPRIMTTARDTYLALRTFVDELARCGLREACTSPGSRSTPLVLSLVREPRIRSTSHLDERCGGFFALGVAKASGLPAALACTSGTAAANYAPAVIEAHEARVPLLVLTADRPPELRDLGAGQTIDQVKLYGSAAKWYLEVDAHPATPERLRWMRQLACRAFWTALEGRPGPVHLNFTLREPLVLDDELVDDGGGRAGGRPWVTRPPVPMTPPPGLVDGLQGELERRPQAIVVAGRAERDPALGPALAAFAERAGLPLLAEPLSGARRGPAAIAHYDALLRDPGWAAAHAPDLVLRVGDLPTSKPLRLWLAGLDGALQIAFDPEAAWQDPAGAVATIVAADPRATVEALGGEGRDFAWLDRWRRADRAAAAGIATALGPAGLTEPRVAAELGAGLPPDATLVVASSMPVRDVETFFPARPDPPRVLSNRGANGIDGTVSTAFGAAAASEGPVVLLIGDVALAHDVGGLLAASRTPANLTIVLLHNDGGGIFHFLPVSREGTDFEAHVATPHGLDFAHAAALYGCRYETVDTPEAFRAALGRALGAPETAIVAVHTDREANVVVHRAVWDAVAQSVR